MSEKLNLLAVNQDEELTGRTWPRHGEDCMQPKIHSLEALNELGSGRMRNLCPCLFLGSFALQKRKTKQKKMEEISLFFLFFFKSLWT